MNLENAINLAKTLEKTVYIVQQNRTDENSFLIYEKEYIPEKTPTSYTVCGESVVKERLYPTPVGLCHSVTHILSETKPLSDQIALQRWKQKMDSKHFVGAADIIRDVAAQRGTEVHSLIDDYLSFKPVESDNPYFSQIVPLLKELQGKVMSFEKFTYSALGYAGRFDLLAEYQGRKTIFDWKTSDNPKQKKRMNFAFLQTTAYAIAENERQPDLGIDQIAVVVLTRDSFQLFVEPLNLYFDEWLSRIYDFKYSRSSNNASHSNGFNKLLCKS